MTINLDSYLGIHAQALGVREQRAAQIANNIANANTPHYQAKDIDFKEVLATKMASSGQNMATTSTGHIAPQADFNAQLKYRVSAHHSLDGNTVDKDFETSEFAQNALGYQASLSFLDSKIKSMMFALKGE